jgi:hypothetical protein
LSVKLTAFGSYPQAEQYFNSIFMASSFGNGTARVAAGTCIVAQAKAPA